MINKAPLHIITLNKEIKEITLIKLCDFFVKRYRNAMKKGAFNFLINSQYFQYNPGCRQAQT